MKTQHPVNLLQRDQQPSLGSGPTSAQRGDLALACRSATVVDQPARVRRQPRPQPLVRVAQTALGVVEPPDDLDIACSNSADKRAASSRAPAGTPRAAAIVDLATIIASPPPPRDRRPTRPAAPTPRYSAIAQPAPDHDRSRPRATTRCPTDHPRSYRCDQRRCGERTAPLTARHKADETGALRPANPKPACAALWYAVTVGIPNPRCPPPAFGIYRRRIAPGW